MTGKREKKKRQRRKGVNGRVRGSRWSKGRGRRKMELDTSIIQWEMGTNTEVIQNF